VNKVSDIKYDLSN